VQGYENGERWDVFCALPTAPHSILDVGCGVGLGFQSYRQRGVRLVGVDNDPHSIAAAAGRMDEVLLLDIEHESWPAHFVGVFDVVAFCDCLEHLADPWRVLASVRPLLAPGGRVVASVPNIRQWRLIAKLAFGRWEYLPGAGTIQRGHLRFFTRQTIVDLFCEAGFDSPRFFWPLQTFHLRPLERRLHRLTGRRFPDLLYGSYTVAATSEC
jgi:SAM-dependent methyltransferase